MGMAPRLKDEAEDLKFLTDVHKREEAGRQIVSIGAGTVHLRLQLLFRVSAGGGGGGGGPVNL